MTSASELFYQRRSRGGRANSDLPYHPSSSSSSDRGCQLNYIRRHHNYHNNSRHDLDGCETPRRSHHSRHSSHRHSPAPERSSAGLEQGSNQFVVTSNLNVDALNSSSPRGSSRAGLMGNERLPGDVLLARARLVERLRGVSLSDTRHTGRFGFHNRPVPLGEDLRVDDGADWAPSMSTGLSPRTSVSTDSEFQLEGWQSTQQQQFNQKKPPGLTPDDLDCLHLEIFSSFGKIGEVEIPQMQQASWDCSICLESFTEGDSLVRLPCEHRFHSACLDPWVRTCGDCPYCRRNILLLSSNNCV